MFPLLPDMKVAEFGPAHVLPTLYEMDCMLFCPRLSPSYQEWTSKLFSLPHPPCSLSPLVKLLFDHRVHITRSEMSLKGSQKGLAYRLWDFHMEEEHTIREEASLSFKQGKRWIRSYWVRSGLYLGLELISTLSF